MRVRQSAIRPMVIYAIYVVSFAVLQVTILQDFRVFGEQPDLTLILAVLTGYLFGLSDGIMVGLAAGFLRDMLAGRGLGLGMLLLMYAAMIAHWMFRDFFRRKTWMGVFQVLFITLIFEFVLVMLSWFFPQIPDQIPPFRGLMAQMMARLPIQSALNMLASIPVLLLLRYRGPYDPRVLREDLDDGSTGEGRWRTI